MTGQGSSGAIAAWLGLFKTEHDRQPMWESRLLQILTHWVALLTFARANRKSMPDVLETSWAHIELQTYTFVTYTFHTEILTILGWGAKELTISQTATTIMMTI